MTKKVVSKAVRKPKTAPKLKKLNRTEASILKSLSHAVAWAKGDDVPGMRMRQVYVPADPDVKAIRQRLGLSQEEFARRFGFSASTLRNWEQGTRRPETTARILLTIIEKAPNIVEGILGDEFTSQAAR
jgi:putative transcriptional regulator